MHYLPSNKIRGTLVVFLVLGCCVPSSRSRSQDLVEAEETAFRQAVERIAPSVVQIETFGGQQRAGEELSADGPTTGTIVAADGWIISSLFSFRRQPASVLVSMPDGRRVAARIVARDFSRELALLKVEASDLPVPEIYPKQNIEVGQWALAIGKTYDAREVSQSVGIISATGRAYDKAIQTDAKVSPINYGGPLIDLTGRVLGILSPLAPGAFLEGDSTELYDSGIGFAIPMEDILNRLEILQSGEDLYSGKLGIVASDQNELSGPVKITGAVPGSPAAKAGVRANDLIRSAQGKPVELLANLRHAMGPVDAGQIFQFEVDRGGETIALQCALTSEIPIYNRRYLGLRLEEVVEPENGVSVQVTNVDSDSPASAAPFQQGQVIIGCNEQSNPSIDDLRKILAVAELDQPIHFTVRDVSGKESGFDVLAEVWPSSIPATIPAISSNVDPELKSTIADVTIGDFPNDAYAVVPAQTSERLLGLLVLFPEPGSLEREKTLNQWSRFCQEYGWIIVVINSGNPRAWSREEVELAGRVIGKMENTYQLDKSRVVTAGVGVGGRVALLAGATQIQRVAGVMTIGTDPGSFSVRQANMPMQSLDFLFVGPSAKLEKATRALRDNGYATTTIDVDNIEAERWESWPNDAIQRWLEGLNRL